MTKLTQKTRQINHLIVVLIAALDAINLKYQLNVNEDSVWVLRLVLNNDDRPSLLLAGLKRVTVIDDRRILLTIGNGRMWVTADKGFVWDY